MKLDAPPTPPHQLTITAVPLTDDVTCRPRAAAGTGRHYRQRRPLAARADRTDAHYPRRAGHIGAKNRRLIDGALAVYTWESIRANGGRRPAFVRRAGRCRALCTCPSVCVCLCVCARGAGGSDQTAAAAARVDGEILQTAWHGRYRQTRTGPPAIDARRRRRRPGAAPKPSPQPSGEVHQKFPSLCQAPGHGRAGLSV